MNESSTKGLVVVWGLLASRPFGGMTWQALHYIEGFRRLGFDVWYVEDRINDVVPTEPRSETYDFQLNVDFAAKQLDRIGLADQWVIRDPVSPEVFYGQEESRLKSLYDDCELLVNVTGAFVLDDNQRRLDGLIYVETDPVLNQIWVAQGLDWLIDDLGAYSALFTYGENVGQEDCPVPVELFKWHGTRPPVIQDWWSSEAGSLSGDRMTTIASWAQSNKDLEWNNETYLWSKNHEFRKLIDLPRKSSIPLELCLSKIPQAEMKELQDHGWIVSSAEDVWGPDAYKAFICGSMGEFTVAKDQNVRLNTGWFSDRSVCYLAAGRPVVTQETGFSKYIPVGEGLFSFRTEAQAVDALSEIAGDYEKHSRAAVDLAREYFSYDRVLPKLLTDSGLM
jgi:hypothetical protein